jgi:hypothetical protein
MRSSKQRQRNKQNRQSRPSGGNIINRVFDSSGPEGKVRGTPQQIIEKYLQLHRDAQLSGDRVNAENFAQHAEHYSRLLAEAQRDIERAREEQEQFHRERQQERDRQFEQSRDNREPRENRDGPPREPRDGQPRDGQPRDGRDRDGRDRGSDFNRDRPRFRPAEDQPVAAEPSFLSQPLFPVLVAEPEDDAAPEPALVETPEERVQTRRERPRREDFERRPRREEQPAERAEAPVEEAPAAAPVAAAEEAPAKAPRRPRKPRAPRAEVAPDAAE